MQPGEKFACARKPCPLRGKMCAPRFRSLFALFACLLLACFWLLASTARAEDFPGLLNWRNVEFTSYARGTAREIFTCKIQKVFADHRRLGFFRVRLLPVLVIQGVQLELAAGKADGEWAQAFRSTWLPDLKGGSTEWRDVSLTLKKADPPRLQAARAFPSSGGGTVVCEFKDVTLQAGGQKWRTPQARLLDENGRPCVVWKTNGGEHHLDLFSEEISITRK